MKPINFAYVKEHKQIEFPDLKYDYKSNLSKFGKKIFVRSKSSKAIELSKTFSDKEKDDDSNVILYTTKTNTQRESDDNFNDNYNINLSVIFMSKTENSRERDDK